MGVVPDICVSKPLPAAGRRHGGTGSVPDFVSEVDPRRLQGVPHLTEAGEVVGDEKLLAVENG